MTPSAPCPPPAARATRVRGHRARCACNECTRTSSRYKKQRALAQIQGVWQSPVDAAPYLATIQQYLDAAWTIPQIAGVTGLDYKLVRILADAPGAVPPEELRPATVKALRRLHGASRIDPRIPGGTFIDATGARRQLQALAAFAWPQPALAAQLGKRGEVRLAAKITVTNARAVNAVYATLSVTRGPSSSAAIRAQARGFAPPAAWEGLDIGDPRTVPDFGAPANPTEALVENAEWLHAEHGMPWEAVADRLKVRKDTLHQYRSRARERAAAAAAPAAP